MSPILPTQHQPSHTTNPLSATTPNRSGGVEHSTVTSNAGTYSMMRQEIEPSENVSLSMNSISYGNPMSDQGSDQYVKEQPLDLKDTARSNNNTAAFGEDSHNVSSLPLVQKPLADTVQEQSILNESGDDQIEAILFDDNDDDDY